MLSNAPRPFTDVVPQLERLSVPRSAYDFGVTSGDVTRGMLEMWIDPESPYHKPVFAEDKRFVFFCAGGWRSALAAQTAHRMGLRPVAHIKGGYGAWRKTGGPTEPQPAKPKSS